MMSPSNTHVNTDLSPFQGAGDPYDGTVTATHEGDGQVSVTFTQQEGAGGYRVYIVSEEGADVTDATEAQLVRRFAADATALSLDYSVFAPHPSVPNPSITFAVTSESASGIENRTPVYTTVTVENAPPQGFVFEMTEDEVDGLFDAFINQTLATDFVMLDDVWPFRMGPEHGTRADLEGDVAVTTPEDFSAEIYVGYAADPEAPAPTLEPLPYIVVVVDEFADMMMIVGKKVEELIARLAQKARASGIHLILATQRPSVDVITGLIKANIPTRMAFQVSSRVDSRTILDQQGAENLLGHGDMLYLPPGSGMPERIHGAFVDDHEVHAVVEWLRSQGQPEYLDDVLADSQTMADGQQVGETGLPETAPGEESDELYDKAVAYVLESRRASISGVQRQLRIGYNRAARLIEEMEAQGIVSAPEQNGQREVLAPKNQA